jgi:hypothetical protein
VAFLAVGILMMPVWVGMLVAPVFSADYRGVMSGIEGLAVVASILAVVGGIFGLIGLFRVMKVLLNPTVSDSVTRRTRIYVVIGVATPLLLAIVFLWRDLRAMMYLSILPLLAAGHIVYLARKTLLRHEHKSTPAT